MFRLGKLRTPMMKCFTKGRAWQKKVSLQWRRAWQKKVSLQWRWALQKKVSLQWRWAQQNVGLQRRRDPAPTKLSSEVVDTYCKLSVIPRLKVRCNIWNKMLPLLWFFLVSIDVFGSHFFTLSKNLLFTRMFLSNHFLYYLKYPFTFKVYLEKFLKHIIIIFLQINN